MAAAGLGIVSFGLLTRLRGRRHLALLGFYALTVLALLVLLHVTEYRALITGGGGFLQGRYLLPVVGLLGLAVGLVIARLPLRLRPSACAVALTVLLVAQAISLSAISTPTTYEVPGTDHATGAASRPSPVR